MTNRLNIVQIQSALLLPVTAAFITDKLGVKPSEVEGRASYWAPEAFTHICQGLIQHITAARNADFSKISAERPKAKKTDAAQPAAAAPVAAAGGGADDFFGEGGDDSGAQGGADDFFGEGGDDSNAGFF